MKSTTVSNTIKGVLPLLFLLFFGGCKKETSNLGIDLIDNNLGNSIKATFADVSARTVPNDSLRTDSLTANIIGVLNDPIFGFSKSSVLIQPRYTETGQSIVGATIDSAFVILSYKRVQTVGNTDYDLEYGDISSELEINVYKLGNTDSIVSGAKYYQSYNPSRGDLVGSYTGKFENSNSDSVTVINTSGDTVEVGPRLSIPLTDGFAQDILSDPTFFSEKNGLIIAPEDNVISGDGAMVGVSTQTSASGVIVYYTEGSEAKRLFVPLGSSSKAINMYETRPSAALIQQFDVDDDYSKVYAMALGGSKVELNVSGLEDIIEMGEDIVINEAKITFNVDESTVTEGYGLPSRLFLQVPFVDEDGTVSTTSTFFIDLIDELQPLNRFWLGYTTYGGDIANSNEYTFRFTRYLQQLKKEYDETGENNFNGFYLSVPSDFPNQPTRVVINSDNMMDDIKLSVTYTKLN